mmetsp:Transcript_10988/g.33699  ORF Transcript_10988/g.33699 Transcript_10988/m.33699 type:complete len:448 (+) Transcript_10988:76-1419(+)
MSVTFCAVAGVGWRSTETAALAVRSVRARGRSAGRTRAKLSAEEEEAAKCSQPTSRMGEEAEARDELENDEFGEPEDEFTAEEVRDVKSIFSPSTFFPTEVLSTTDALIFKGNFRADVDDSLQKLEHSLRAKFNKRLSICIMESETESDSRPSVMVYRSQTPDKFKSSREYTLLLGAFCMYVIISSFLGSPHAVDDLKGIGGIIVTLAVFAMLVMSTLVQRLFARRFNIRFGETFMLALPRPFGLPVSFTPISSNGGSRLNYFIATLAGAPLLLIFAFAVFAYGLALTQAGGMIWQVRSTVISSSWLVTLATRFALGPRLLRSADGEVLGLHPVAVIGVHCIKTAAINLLPFAPFDGGRMISSVFGRKSASALSKVCICIFTGLSAVYPSLLLFILLQFFAAWPADKPPRNCLQSTPTWTVVLSCLLFWTMTITLLPFPWPLKLAIS